MGIPVSVIPHRALSAKAPYLGRLGEAAPPAPAGVRPVCVDINPAVVTKLSDRGSLESL